MTLAIQQFSRWCKVFTFQGSPIVELYHIKCVPQKIPYHKLLQFFWYTS